MTKKDHQPLTQAFEQTDYRILADGQWHTVTIGSMCPPILQAWLKTHGKTRCAWIITAHNPQAEAMDAQANANRDAALKTWLDADNHAYVATDSSAQTGDWPCEPGVCVLDMDEGLARALALRFDQAAMVALPIDQPVQLVWIDG